MGLFSCCGGSTSATDGADAGKQRRHRHRRSHRRKHGPKKSNSLPQNSVEAAPSTLSDSEYQDARDAFSEAGDGGSPTHALSPRESADGGHRLPSDGESFHSEGESFSSSGSEEGDGITTRLVSCLSLIKSGEGITGTERGHKAPRSVAVPGRSRPVAGMTLPRRPASLDPALARGCWDEVHASSYRLRSLDYMKNKVKIPSDKAIYRCVAVDVYSTPQKAFHVARSVHLPPTGAPVVVPGSSTSDSTVLPPLLVMNVQLPNYPASFFGANDGPGLSIVYYYTLPEDFDPAKFENQKALGLLQRFVANGREADGSPTRERLKFIPRVVNVAEWVAAAQMTSAEARLLSNYNEKPVLTRPQQTFYVGPNYLEVDLDVHSYAFLARKALNGYHTRLKDVVWDNAFVLQGNGPDELPEQLLCASRIYRTNLLEVPTLEDAFAAMTPGATPMDGPTPLASPRQQQHISVGAGLRGGEAANGTAGSGAAPSPLGRLPETGHSEARV